MLQFPDNPENMKTLNNCSRLIPKRILEVILVDLSTALLRILYSCIPREVKAFLLD